jgi:ABC-type dipeptide/oligopeptide/nickel transport system permease subunit
LLVLTLASFQQLGDALRDQLDVRQRERPSAPEPVLAS